ncbi:MAG TPA: hypothetical protein VG326_19080 [Tepidisphaeraceae bacterium]|nr:hypothetical protein [Tepidisphaeraceae bacterium]
MATPSPISKPLARSVYAPKLSEFSEFTFAEELAFQFRGAWRDFFTRRIGPAFDGRIILEIGCFDAAFLGGIAVKYPGAAFIGLDWKCKAIYDGAQRVARLGLRNVALLRARGQDLPRILEGGEVDEIWIFHPEPGETKSPSQSHLIDEGFLIDIHHVLANHSSVMAFKTDHSAYYRRLLALSESEPIRSRFAVTIASTDFWNDPTAISHTCARYFSNEMTTYERRFVKRRVPIFYVEMRKTAR